MTPSVPPMYWSPGLSPRRTHRRKALVTARTVAGADVEASAGPRRTHRRKALVTCAGRRTPCGEDPSEKDPPPKGTGDLFFASSVMTFVVPSEKDPPPKGTGDDSSFGLLIGGSMPSEKDPPPKGTGDIPRRVVVRPEN